MPAKRWTTDEQLALVQGFLPVFAKVSNEPKKAMKRFWPTLEKAWFAAYPLKQELVASDILPAVVLQENYEFVKGSTEEKIYQKQLEKRVDQLKTLIRYEYRQANLKAGIVDGNRSAIGTAAKGFVKAQHRCPQPQEMYYRLFQAEIDAMFKEEREAYVDQPSGENDASEEVDIAGVQAEDGDDAKGKKGLKRARGWNLRLRRKIFTREWESASEERKVMVHEEIQKERAEMAMEANLNETGKALACPIEYRLGSMQRINAFWGSNAQLCWENAAMMSVQIGVAPDPADGDRLMTMSISCGLDQNGKVFQDVFPNFQEVFVKPILTWAKNNVFVPAAWAKAKAEAEKARAESLAPGKQKDEAEKARAESLAPGKQKDEDKDKDDHEEDQEEDHDDGGKGGRGSKQGQPAQEPEVDGDEGDKMEGDKTEDDAMLVDISRPQSPDTEGDSAFDDLHGISHQPEDTEGEVGEDTPKMMGSADAGVLLSTKGATASVRPDSPSRSPPRDGMHHPTVTTPDWLPSQPVPANPASSSPASSQPSSAPSVPLPIESAMMPGRPHSVVSTSGIASLESGSSTTTQAVLDPPPIQPHDQRDGAQGTTLPNVNNGLPPPPPAINSQLPFPPPLTHSGVPIPSLQSLMAMGRARGSNSPGILENSGGSSKAAATLLNIVAAASKATTTAISTTAPIAGLVVPTGVTLPVITIPQTTTTPPTEPTAMAATIVSFQTNVPNPNPKAKSTGVAAKPSTSGKKGKKKGAKAQEETEGEPDGTTAREPTKKRKAAKAPPAKPAKAAKTMAEPSPSEDVPQPEGRSRRIPKPAKRFDGGVYVEVSTAKKTARSATR